MISLPLVAQASQADSMRRRSVGLLGSLRERFAGAGLMRHQLVLQHLGMTPAQVRTLRSWLATVGTQLDLRIELQAQQGSVLVIEQDAAAHMAPAALEAMGERQPLVILALAGAAAAGSADQRVALRLAERGQRELLMQLAELKAVRRLSPHWQGSGWEPESGIPESALQLRREAEEAQPDEPDDDNAPPLGAERTQLLVHLLRGLNDATTAPLLASYGAGANLQVDFAQRLVRIDLKALRQLRVQQLLPRCVDGVRVSDEAILRELDETVWDVAMACGRHRLFGAPPDWWRRPLLPACADGADVVGRLTRLPRQLELARLFFGASPGSLSAAALRSLAVTCGRLGDDKAAPSILDIRRFVQACLFLKLVRWGAAFEPTQPVALDDRG